MLSTADSVPAAAALGTPQRSSNGVLDYASLFGGSLASTTPASVSVASPADAVDLTSIQSHIDALDNVLAAFRIIPFHHKELTAAFREQSSALPPLAQRGDSEVEQIDFARIADEEASSPFLRRLTAENILEEIHHCKTLFKQLKFNFIELDTKEKFLRGLLNERGPSFTFADENVALETQLQANKRELKEAKQAYHRLSEEMIALANTVQQQYAGAEGIVEAATEVLEQLRAVHEQGAVTIAQDHSYERPSYEHERQVLQESKARTAALDQQAAEYARQVKELQAQIDAMSADTERMESYCKQVQDEAGALQAQWNEQRNAEVQLTAQWLLELTALLGRLTCIKRVIPLPNNVFRFTLSIATEPPTSVDLVARVNATRTRIIDARVDEYDSEPVSFAYCPLELVVGRTYLQPVAAEDTGRVVNDYAQVVEMVRAAVLRRAELDRLATRYPVRVLEAPPTQRPHNMLTVEVRLNLPTPAMSKPRLIAQLHPLYPLGGGVMPTLHVPSELSAQQLSAIQHGLSSGQMLHKSLTDIVDWMCSIGEQED
ncbi:hypothetical protein RI367_007125 [Sorochytrium milnesiophthora]